MFKTDYLYRVLLNDGRSYVGRPQFNTHIQSDYVEISNTEEGVYTRRQIPMNLIRDYWIIGSDNRLLTST